MKKKTLALIMAAAMVMGLTACGSAADTTTETTETTEAAKITEQIRYAELHTQAVSHRIWLSIGILLLLIPAAAIFKLIDKISVICIRRLHG